jgi:ParB family chromosome partitioning protein
LIPEHQQYFDGSRTGNDENPLIAIIPLSKLRPNPAQPRKSFSEATLLELADSISRHGLLQPIIAEKLDDQNYMIIAGERRFRAAGLAGLNEVPVIIRASDADKRLELSLIENVQREDLNPLEEALAYQSLLDISDSTQEEVAKTVGKNRSTVANSLRLLRLPEEIQVSLKDGGLTAGHARSLLSIPEKSNQLKLFRKIVDDGLSVRQTEEEARRIVTGEQSSKGSRKKKPDSEKSEQRDPELRALRERLIGKFGTKVEIMGSQDRGSIVLEYYSGEDLQRVLDVLGMGQTD